VKKLLRGKKALSILWNQTFYMELQMWEQHPALISPFNLNNYTPG